jgi:hypothetical protein
VTEGNETFDGSRPDRDWRVRAGVALVSRFIGAVFLVLLGGLLLLDRSLLHANQDQLSLDAEWSALLVESYIRGQATVVGQIADAMSLSPPISGAASDQQHLERLVRNIPGLHYAWSTDGRTLNSVGHDVDSVVQRIGEQHAGVATPGLTITVVSTRTGRVLAVLAQGALAHATGRVTGIIIDASPVESLLTRIKPRGRISLAVTSGNDTIAFTGHAGSTAGAMPVDQKVIRLPTGGTWTVSAVHAMTTRSLRWALWAVGVTGVLFLALGLLREQRRVIEAASRST